MAKKVTKKALLASVLSLSICTTMLIGTSYAWFTDSVTSSGNIIKSGTLDVAMQWAEGRYDPTTESDDDPETDDIVWYEAEGDNAKKMFDAEMLWEPGYTAARHIRISNEGSLALKYNLTILANGDADDVADLASVIDVYTKTPAVQVSNRDNVSTTLNRVGTLREVLNDTTVLAAATQDHLLAGEKEAILTLALKMQETAGNEYQNKQVNATFDVVLYATQYTEETDSFDKQYDKLATYDSANVGNDLTLVNRNTAAVTQVTVPASAAQVNDVFELSVTNSGVDTDTAGKSTLSLDITLTKNGVALDTPDINNTEYAVEVYVGKNLNLTAVKHNGTPVNFTYDAATGIVSFTVTSFSPFTVEYNAPKTITFVGGEGTTGTMEAQNVYAGVEAALTANSFEKTGHSFAGWATTAGGEKVYGDGAAITVTESTTLYALWDANPYEVVFNAQGGTGDMANQTINYGASANLTANAYTKTGHDFMGWTATEGGTTVDYANQASYTMNTLGATLYAVWTANDYNVTFDGNGATSGSMQAQNFTFGTSENLTANAFAKTGYSFAGWAESANGEAVYADTQSYTMNTEGATLYAKWAANNYNVTFDGNGATSGSMEAQSIAYDSSANLTANAFAKTGYSFAGWATSANGNVVYTDTASYTMNTEGATLYAVWQANSYNVTFHINNGSENTYTQNFTFGEQKNLTANTFNNAGYAFAGWATSAGGNVVYADEASYKMNTEGADLYAKWDKLYSYMAYDEETGKFYKAEHTAKKIVSSSSVSGYSDGWYVVEGEITTEMRIFFSGNCHLILADGATLNANGCVMVSGDNVLNIYGQENGTGKLIAKDALPSGYNGEGAAGIGGHSATSLPTGYINIYGGTIIASGARNAAGIGGGKGQAPKTINIYGGTITATGGANASGIGCGSGATGGNVNIYGGTITATGASGKSGISGTLTVAEGLGVFGGDSANPTAEIEAPYTSRPRYMVVKKILSVETFNTSEAPSSSSWPINYSLTDFKVRFRMKTQNGMYIASGDNYSITVSALTGKNIEKMEVKLGSWWASSHGQYLTATKGTVVFPETVTNGSVITINDINATSVKLSLSEDGVATNIDSIKVYYYK